MGKCNCSKYQGCEICGKYGYVQRKHLEESHFQLLTILESILGDLSDGKKITTGRIRTYKEVLIYAKRSELERVA